MTDAGVVVWYNPSCSKCRGAGELLAAYGVPEQRVFYLDNPPSEAEIARVLALLGTDDPRALMRTGEPRYAELGLENASRDELIAAMARYPELIERPVVIWPDRAIVARPPELLLPLLEAGRVLRLATYRAVAKTPRTRVPSGKRQVADRQAILPHRGCRRAEEPCRSAR